MRTRSAETRPTETRATTATQAERPRTAQPADKRALKGFVKNGVVHLLEGELPENCFVRVTPE
jgi:probable phosphoglycerate mutase